ncbi:MAG: C40 family peptidase [Gaiellaceae bacterium]
MRAAFGLGLVAIALAAAPAAAADVFGAAQVRTADGALLASARGAPFAYPADGSVLSIGSVTATQTRVDLKHVSMLGGNVQADRVLIDAHVTAIEGLVVNGLLRTANQNSLFSLDGSSYLVVRQTAVIGKTTGFVGLRLVVPPGYPGLPTGAQVLVGLREHGDSKKARLARTVVRSAGPWATLGFAASPSFAGLPTVSDPLLAVSLPPTSGDAIGARAVAIAEQFLGVPYLWGGASPATGFDCSGLTMFVYAQLGIGLIHYAAAQLHEGYPVPPDLLMPGDLVFFDPSFGGPGHVGMYIGAGLFIHAPHTGDVVKISSLAQYARGYVGAVRPFR